MMIFSLVAMTGLEKCCITSAYLQWLCHSGERPVARRPLVEVIIMNLAQNVCLDDFKVIYIFLSSDFLKFFRLGQFLSNYWSYRVIFGICEVFVFRSISQ